MEPLTPEYHIWRYYDLKGYFIFANEALPEYLSREQLINIITTLPPISAVEQIKNLLKVVGAPTTAKELGIPDEIVVKAISIAHTLRKRYTILGESGIEEKAAEKAARIVGVIE